MSAGLRIKVTIDDDEAPRCQVTTSPRDREHSRDSFLSDKSSRITPTIIELISVQTIDNAFCVRFRRYLHKGWLSIRKSHDCNASMIIRLVDSNEFT